MQTYLIRLAAMVVGAFLSTLAGLLASQEIFNVLTFDWPGALTVSGSAAVLVLVKGLAARFVGDAERPNLTR